MRLVLCVPEDDVAFLVRLEIPGADKHNVSLPHPSALLHLTPDTADTGLAVLTLHAHPCLAEVLDHNPQDVIPVREHHSLSDVPFVLD